MSWEPLTMSATPSRRPLPTASDSWSPSTRMSYPVASSSSTRLPNKLERELEDDDDLQKALEASKTEYEALQRERDMYQRILDQSASEAALAEQTDQLDLDRARQLSEQDEEARLTAQREHEEDMERVMRESAFHAAAEQAEFDEMLEQALKLSQQIAQRDYDRRRGWGSSSESSDEPTVVAAEEAMEEGPLRVFGPSGISLVWRDGTSTAPAPYNSKAPLTRSATQSKLRPLPQTPGPPGNAHAGPSRQALEASFRPERPPKLPRASDSAPKRTASFISQTHDVDADRTRPLVPAESTRPVSMPNRQSTLPTFGEHPPTISTLGRTPTTLSSLAIQRDLSQSTAAESAVADSVVVQDGHTQPAVDPFGDEFADDVTTWSHDSYLADGHHADDEDSEFVPTPVAPAARIFEATPESPVSVAVSPRIFEPSPSMTSPTEEDRPPGLAQPPARNAFVARDGADLQYATRPTSYQYPADIARPSAARRRSSGERREGRVAAGAIIPPEPRADVEDVSRWGFLGRRLIKGDGLPDVIQLSNAAGEGKYSVFLLESPTWRTLLRLLMWYGSTRLEASPRDFVDRKSEAAFQCNIVLDFFATTVCLSLRLLPSTRGRSKLFSASRRCTVVPTSPIALPTTLASLAIQLHETLSTARTAHHGSLYGLQNDVDSLARAAGEPLSASLELERGMLERLKAKMRKQSKRRPTQLGEEALGDDAVLIQPFRLDEYGG